MGSIVLNNIHKRYRIKGGWRNVLNGLSFEIPTDYSLGVLGRNGTGKSTLMGIISRVIYPDQGDVRYGGLRVSWPIGGGGLQGSLTAKDNIRFICRVMAYDYQQVVEYVDDFAELGPYMDMPVKTYSSGMKSRLTFGICMALNFDTYLVDEGFNAGDARFTKKMQDVFSEKRKSANMICVSHNPKILRSFCDKAAILKDGQLIMYEDMDAAIKDYKKL